MVSQKSEYKMMIHGEPSYHKDFNWKPRLVGLNKGWNTTQWYKDYSKPPLCGGFIYVLSFRNPWRDDPCFWAYFLWFRVLKNHHPWKCLENSSKVVFFSEMLGRNHPSVANVCFCVFSLFHSWFCKGVSEKCMFFVFGPIWTCNVLHDKGFNFEPKTQKKHGKRKNVSKRYLMCAF